MEAAEVEPGRDQIDVPSALGIGPGGHTVEVEGFAAATLRAVFMERNGHTLDRPALFVPNDPADRGAPLHRQRIGPGNLGFPAARSETRFGTRPSPRAVTVNRSNGFSGKGMTIRPDSSVMSWRASLPSIKTFRLTPERGLLLG